MKYQTRQDFMRWLRPAARVRVCLAACGLGAWLSLAGCDAGSRAVAARPRSEVIVMGMIHDEHRTSETYGIDTVKQIIRRINPDYVLCEIPPDRYPTAVREFRATGKIREPRVSRFPEYTEALFPLTKEMHFEIIPCAAWTKAMSDARNATLERMKTERPEDYRASEEAMDWLAKKLEAEGLADTPRGIHSPRYDELVRVGMDPYDRLFNDVIGPGGWTNINKAHYALVSKALDAHRGEHKRFLVMFGAWHKYWLLDHLRQRSDITVRPLTDFLPPEPRHQPALTTKPDATP